MKQPDRKLDRHKFFDRNERRAILTHSEAEADKARAAGTKTWVVRWMLVDLAFYSGLRVSEIAKLKIKDCHLNDSPYIRVRDGKGGKDRDVYIRDQLAHHLQEFIASKPQRNEPDSPPVDPLFAGRNGHYTPTALTISFKTAVKETPGLRENLSIHSARHTFATFLYSDTKHLRYVQSQLGHASIKTTQQYVGILPEDNSKLANMMS